MKDEKTVAVLLIFRGEAMFLSQQEYQEFLEFRHEHEGR